MLISAAVALAAHLVLIGVLVLGIRASRPPSESPAIEVTLSRLFHVRPKPVVKIPPAPARRSAPKAASTKATPTIAGPSPLPPPVALPENGPIDPKLAAAEAVRGALQAYVRCAHPDAGDMSQAERDACARHIRDLRAGAPTYAIGPHLAPLVASHGVTVVNHLSPRPGTDLGPLDMGPVKGVSH